MCVCVCVCEREGRGECFSGIRMDGFHAQVMGTIGRAWVGRARGGLGKDWSWERGVTYIGKA